MNEDQVRKIVQDEMQKAQYNVSNVPFHVHNQIDSPNIPAISVTDFVSLPSNNTSNDTAGVPDPYAGVISDDNISPFEDAFPNVVYPTTVIGGFSPGDYSNFNGGDAPLGTLIGFYNANTLGTVSQLWIALEETHTTELNFTGSVSSGATSATLDVIWIWQDGDYIVKFSNGNTRTVTFSNGATTATWTGGLTSNATAIFNVTIFTQWFEIGGGGGGGSPGGINNSIQFNNSGSFDGTGGIVYSSNIAGTFGPGFQQTNADPITIYGDTGVFIGTAGGTISINTTDDLFLNDNILLTTATSGFIYIPTMAGTPTGTPTEGGAMVFNTTANKLHIYNGSAWKSVTLT